MVPKGFLAKLCGSNDLRRSASTHGVGVLLDSPFNVQNYVGSAREDRVPTCNAMHPRMSQKPRSTHSMLVLFSMNKVWMFCFSFCAHARELWVALVCQAAYPRTSWTFHLLKNGNAPKTEPLQVPKAGKGRVVAEAQAAL